MTETQRNSVRTETGRGDELKQCPACNATSESEQRFCGQCGKPFDSSSVPVDSLAPSGYTPPYLASQILQSRSAIEGERKQVTVLFCDIADSTALAERIGADRMHGVLNQFFDLALNSVHQFEGSVNQFLGDGFMALFGAPITYEDHARRGVLAALHLRDTLGQSAGLGIRMGLSTGFVVVGKIGDNLRMDYTAIGDTTNIAARLQAEAETGQILITSTVKRLVQGIIQSDDLGSRALKGVAEPVTVHAVLRIIDQGLEPQTAVDETPTVLVGRDSELASIQKVAADLAGGTGSLITVLGEAGTGKSRLLVEAQTQIQQHHIRIVRGGCQAHTRLESYRPLREVVRQLLGIAPGVDGLTAMALLANRMCGWADPGGEDLSAYIGALMGWVADPSLILQLASLDRLALNQQIIRALRRLLTHEAGQTPTLIILDDWHWADESSASTLCKIFDLCNTNPLSFLVAARPDVGTPADTLSDRETPSPVANRAAIALSGLPDDATAALAANLVSGGKLSASLKLYLYEQTAGNPFYLGELIHALREAGSLRQAGRPSEWGLTADAQDDPLPGTIEGVILARVDRLDESAKVFLKAASVIGRQFDADSAARLLKSTNGISVTVQMLVDKGLLAIDTGAGKQRLQFTHPLIQKAVYDSILQSQRQQWHLKIAHDIEQHEPAEETQFFATIAYHYAEAQESDQALKFLALAGDRAREVAADSEALAHYELALQVAEKLPRELLDRDSRADMHQKIGEALFRLTRHEAAAHHIGLALSELGVELPNRTGPLRIAVGREVMSLLRRSGLSALKRQSASDAVVDQVNQRICALLELRCWIDYFRDVEQWLLDVLLLSRYAQQQSSTDYRALSMALSSLFFDSIGWRMQADRLTRRSLQIAENSTRKTIMGQCHFFRGLCLYHSGRVTEMLTELETASRIFRQLKSVRHYAMADGVGSFTKFALGQIDWFNEGHELYHTSIEIGDEHAVGIADLMLALEAARKGWDAQAVDRFKLAIDAFRRVPDNRQLVSALGAWAAHEVMNGRWQEAISLCDQCEPLILENRLSGIFLTWTRMAKASALVRAVETTHDPNEHGRLLKKAHVACRQARRQGRSTRDNGAQEALRISASLAWLEGKSDLAQRYWRQSLDVGQQLGFRISAAHTYYDMGRLMENMDHLEWARSEFESMQAAQMVSECQRSIAQLKNRR